MDDLTDEQAALAANEAFYTAFNVRDMGAMEAIWARVAAVSCIHPGWMPLHGRADVLKSWAAILANAGQPRVLPGAATAQVLGDVAIVSCRELVSGSPLVATNVFAREDGAWRMILHHTSPVAVRRE